MRGVVGMTVTMAVLAGCQAERAHRRHQAVPSAVASLITEAQAKDIAMRAMNTPTNLAPFVHVLPAGTNMTWTIQLADPIAGAWEVMIHRKTGAVLNKRTMPAR